MEKYNNKYELITAINKLDMLSNKIDEISYKAEDKLFNLLCLELHSVVLIRLVYHFILRNKVIVDEVVKHAENFYNKTKNDYKNEFDAYINLDKKYKKYYQKFAKIANQLEYLV